jgi:hypothetical protein
MDLSATPEGEANEVSATPEEANEIIEEEVIENLRPQKEQKKQTSFKSPGEDNNDNKEYWDLVYLRNTRNSLLQSTDKYLIPDYPISPENLEIIKLYRQELRDFININSSNILNGVIPEIPPIPL